MKRLDHRVHPIKSLSLAAALWVAAASSTACVSYDAGYGDVRRLTAERTHNDVHWREIDGDGGNAKQTREILARPLTADAAVQVALLNNRGLQASFENLGIARADVVRALRLPNPSAEAAVRFGGNDANPEIELWLLEDISDLLVLPLRSGAARAELDATKISVASDVIDVAFSTRAAYYEHQAALQTLELRAKVLEATSASFEAASALRVAGNTTELALASERALYEESRIALARAEAERVASREKLGALLGLAAPSATWSIATRLPDLPAVELDVHRLEQSAVEKSLDLASTRYRVEAAGKEASYARVRGWVPGLGVGASAERRDGWAIGPAAQVSVPLFYQGQGETGRALAEMRRERELFADTSTRIRAAARGLGAKLTTARATVSYYRDVLLPLQNKIVDETGLQYNAMAVGVFQLLQAKRDQIETARQYVEALRDYWLIRSDADELLAGRLDRAMPAANMPTPTSGANDHGRNE